LEQAAAREADGGLPRTRRTALRHAVTALDRVFGVID
jgi:hypothetical protein